MASKLIYLVSEDWYFLSHRLPMARAARGAGYEVHVLTRVVDGGAAIAHEGFALHPIPWQRGSASPLAALATIRTVPALYKRLKPDIVHHVAFAPTVLGSIAASEPRNRLLGVARVLGFSPRQLGALVGWELAPLAIVAIAAGAVVGAAELQLVLGALDLRPFLGTTDAVAPVLDPLWVAGVIAVFTVVVLVAGFVTAAIARRMSPVSSIKMGAE